MELKQERTRIPTNTFAVRSQNAIYSGYNWLSRQHKNYLPVNYITRCKDVSPNNNKTKQFFFTPFLSFIGAAHRHVQHM